MQTENTLTRGQLAKLAGIGAEAVRFYEKQGLLPKPHRDEAGYRRYPEETAQRLRFITHAKWLGFTLREVRELLDLRDRAGESCGDVRDRIVAKGLEIKRKLRALTLMENAVEKLAAACDGARPIDRCPIIEFIEKMESLEQDCPTLNREPTASRKPKTNKTEKAGR